MGCSSVPEFKLTPVSFGSFEEGYEETPAIDGTIELKIISIHGHELNTLKIIFHRRISEKCGESKYKVYEFGEMIDVCANTKCFETAVQGRYKCT